MSKRKRKASRDEILEFIDGLMGTEETECIWWPYGKGSNGYGCMRALDEDVNTTASRVVCKLAHGQPPSPKMEAAHTCHNGHLGCVNPNHLEWQTKRKNLEGRGEAGRGHFKLTREVATEIWLRRDERTGVLAKEFNLTTRMILYIKRGHRWPQAAEDDLPQKKAA